MTISKEWRKARKPHVCESCRRTIRKGERHQRSFGYAVAGDKPYAIRLCEGCVSK